MVTRCYSAFFPLMIYILHGKFTEGHEIPTARKLKLNERLFASVLVVADKVGDTLNPTLWLFLGGLGCNLLPPGCNYSN